MQFATLQFAREAAQIQHTEVEEVFRALNLVKVPKVSEVEVLVLQ